MIQHNLFVTALVCSLVCHPVRASIYTHSHHHGRRNLAAAIFGFGSKHDDDPNSPAKDGEKKENEDQQTQQQYTPQFPPPPPNGRQQLQMQRMPPPPPRAGGGKVDMPAERDRPDDNTAATTSISDDIPPPPLAAFPPPPPPGANGWQPQQQQQQQQLTDPAFEWMEATPSSPQPWLMMQGEGGTLDQAAEADRFQLIQQDLEASIGREHDLFARLQNVSAVLAGMEQREELHVRQLDVLTARVMDVEAQAAEERNQLLEYQANCSVLDLEIAQLRGEVDEWKERCLKSEDRHKKQQAEHAKLVKKLDKANREAEQLASRVERSRLDEIRGEYKSRKKAKSGGFLGWIFGNQRDDGELAGLREAAKATLLNALKTERNNVEELEATVSMLEQNNSVIALQVQSRDEIIDELNERVAVFEEDKVVLKAALKQLQKEMADEAPKMQKLIQELESTHQEIERLEQDIHQLGIAHQQKVESLEAIIAEKQDKIQETEANVTMIGEYVDKLEERLADFALARRNIDQREEECRVIEQKATQVEHECDNLREQIQQYETEHEELKSLLEELAVDRNNFQGQIAQLTVEKQNAAKEVAALRKSLETLQGENANLLQQLQQEQQRQPPPPPPPPVVHDWEARVKEYEDRLSQLSEQNVELQEDKQRAESTIGKVQAKVEEMVAAQQDLEALLEQAQGTKASLEEKLEEAVKAQEQAEALLKEENERHEAQLEQVEAQVAARIEEKQAALKAKFVEERQSLESQLSQAQERFVSELKEEKEKHAASLQSELEKQAADYEQKHATSLQQQLDMQAADFQQKHAADLQQRLEMQAAEHAAAQTVAAAQVPTFPETGGSNVDDDALLDVAPNRTVAVESLKEDEDAAPLLVNHAIDSGANATASPRHNEDKISTNDTAATRNNVTNRLSSGPPPHSQRAVTRRPMPPKKKESITRSFRKMFAQATGVHGFFSKKYKRQRPQKQRPPPTFATNATRTNSLAPPSSARGNGAAPGRNRDPPGRGQPPPRHGTAFHRNGTAPFVKQQTQQSSPSSRPPER